MTPGTVSVAADLAGIAGFVIAALVFAGAALMTLWLARRWDRAVAGLVDAVARPVERLGLAATSRDGIFAATTAWAIRRSGLLAAKAMVGAWTHSAHRD